MHTISLTWFGARLAAAPVSPWRIQAGTAQTWVAPSAGHMTVVSGRVWASCDKRDGPALDHVLLAGDRLRLRRGQRVVLEPWARAVSDEAWLSWVPS